MSTPVRQASDQQVFGSVAAMEHSGCSGLAQALVDTASGSERVGLDAGIRALLEPSSPRVVFLYTPPEMAVANALFEGLDPVGFLEEWVSQHQLLLGYLNRHRGRWVLLDASEAGVDPGAAISAIGASPQEQALSPVAAQPMALERLLTAGAVQAAPDAQRIAAHLTALSTPVHSDQAEPPKPEDALREYLDRQAESRLQTDAWQRSEREALRAQTLAERARAEAETLAAEQRLRLKEANQVTVAAEKVSEALSSEIAELKSENDLLLRQLHQVQEELESWFVAAPHAALGGLNQAQVAPETQILLLQSQLEELSQASVPTAEAAEQRLSDIQELNSENELLLRQLHQVQEELELWLLKARDREEELKRIKLSRQLSIDEGKARLNQARQNKEIAEKLARDRYEAIQQLRREKRELEKTRSEVAGLAGTQPISSIPLDPTTDLQATPVVATQTPPAENTRVDQTKIPVLQTCLVVPQKITPTSNRLGRLFGRKRRIKGVREKDVEIVRKSELFDGDWYLESNIDVAQAGFDPVEHYLALGFTERRNPSLAFDSEFYLEQNPDVASAGKNPLLHYLRYGQAEGRAMRAAKTR